jgi:hypothetical protein
MARTLYGLFWFFVFLAIVNSTIANANAGVNVASRTGYAMACIGYFASAARRNGRRWNVFLHLIVPVLGIAAFVPAWLTSAGIKAFSFVAPLAAPSSYMGPGVAGFMVIGVIYLVYLYTRHPERVTEVGLVHID